MWSTSSIPRDTSAAQYSIITFTSLSTTGAAGTFSLKAGAATTNAIGARYGNGTFSVKFQRLANGDSLIVYPKSGYRNGLVS